MTIDPCGRAPSRGLRLVELGDVELRAVDTGGVGQGASAGQLAGERALAIADCPARDEITQTV